MSLDQNSSFVDWAKAIMSAGRKMQTSAKAIQKLGDDPFTARKHIRKAISLIEDLGMSGIAPPEGVLEGLEADCLTLEAEFWGRLEEAISNEGWELIGTTDRRLLHRGIFVELTGDQVRIEGVSGLCTPHVPTLIETLRPEVKNLPSSDPKGIRKYVNAIIDAYDMAGGRGELSIEKIYRLAVLQTQKPAFWSKMQPSSLHRFTRPMFRAIVSKLLSEGELLGPHLNLRLGTTVDPKDAWEVFSPGEGRVIQVGRVSIEAQGE